MVQGSVQNAFSLGQTRNFGIIAHINAGKTTTSERMLFLSGVTNRMGEVDHGASTMDWMPQEQERGITITAASTDFAWHDHRCNLIDLPGHVDFTVEVERSLRVLDGAVAIFCASRGVQSQSETVWRQADRYKIPRIAFINKCDRQGANPEQTVKTIRERLRANPIVLQLPHSLEDDFDGLIDLIHFKSRHWDESSSGKSFEDSEIPEALKAEATLARDTMLEALAEVDDSLMSKYLSEAPLSPDEIKQALRRATLAMRAVPVVLGAAKQNQGIQNLLDAVVDFLPSPTDLEPSVGVNPVNNEPEVRAQSTEARASALAFKVMHDADLGQLTYVRVYSGKIRTGDKLLNSSKNRLENVQQLVKMHADASKRIDELQAGDIAAVIGLTNTSTGDTLCDASSPIVFKSIKFPKPVMRLALEMSDLDGRKQLVLALRALESEDPTFEVIEDELSGQIIVQGMGELHLDVIVDRLKTDFRLEPTVGRPQVAYLSTATDSSEALVVHDYFSTTGPKKQSATVAVEITPAEFESGIKTIFDKKCELSKKFAKSIKQGLRDAFNEGMSGCRATGFICRVTRAEITEADDQTLLFKFAALKAGREALNRSKPMILEPLMHVEVVTPDDSVGDVMNDLSARRGKITGIEARSGVQVVSCLVPLEEMFGYSTDLRSRTKGRATYSMEFIKYESVKKEIEEKFLNI